MSRKTTTRRRDDEPTRRRDDETTRKIIVYIATSADGFIARSDGSVDWLDRPRPKGSYGMAEFNRSIDAVLWGRKTLDKAIELAGEKIFGGTSGGTVKNYAFSHNPPAKPIPGLEFVREPIPEFARRLRAQPGRDIWMMGGGGLIASFLDAGEIDEFIIHTIPTFIGEGIPLIAPSRRTVPLRLLNTKGYPDGVVRLHYSVER